jgi:hypothetical protein
MFFRGIMAIYSENTNEYTLLGVKYNLLSVKAGGTYTYHKALKELII